MPEEGGDAPVSVFFKVIDTGEGMSKSTMERVFDRFAMGEHKVSKYGGSGLGLAICRSLAGLMHGEIHCMSQPGRGSTFVLELAMLIDRSTRSSEPRSADRCEPLGHPRPARLAGSSVETGLALEGLRDAPGPSNSPASIRILSRQFPSRIKHPPRRRRRRPHRSRPRRRTLPRSRRNPEASSAATIFATVLRRETRRQRDSVHTPGACHVSGSGVRSIPGAFTGVDVPLAARRFLRARSRRRPPLARPATITRSRTRVCRLDPRSVILRRRRAARVTVRVERDGDSRTRRGNVCGCAGGGSRGG